MKTTDIRVRPVIRHVVTRFTSEPDRGASSSECVAEFAHEGYAEEVAQALTDKAAPRCYVIVEETLGVVEARVMYAYSEEESELRKKELEDTTGKTFKVYSRIREHVYSRICEPLPC